MKVYLDNCCYNRPYDNQDNLLVSLETQAKLFIQSMIRGREIELASSFVLKYENSCNPYLDRRDAIQKFLKENVSDYIDGSKSNDVVKKAEYIMAAGVKMKDACHIACAEIMNCDYLVTTDKRMLRYSDSVVKLVNPIEFIELINGGIA